MKENNNFRLSPFTLISSTLYRKRSIFLIQGYGYLWNLRILCSLLKERARIRWGVLYLFGCVSCAKKCLCRYTFNKSQLLLKLNTKSRARWEWCFLFVSVNSKVLLLLKSLGRCGDKVSRCRENVTWFRSFLTEDYKKKKCFHTQKSIQNNDFHVNPLYHGKLSHIAGRRDEILNFQLKYVKFFSQK